MDRYPLPDVVGGYGTLADFSRARMESGQWVHWPDRVQAVLAGRYDEVMPLHVELCTTYDCPFHCPWCSCGDAMAASQKSGRKRWLATTDLSTIVERLA
jgi:hypothetical protein